MSFAVSLLMATASASRTNDFVPSLMHCKKPLSLIYGWISGRSLTCGTCSMRSGYFLLMSSEFRLNTLIVPSGSKWTCEGGDRLTQRNAVRHQPHLSAFTVIFVLASELLILKPIQHFSDGFGWLRKHGLKRYSWGELTLLAEAADAKLEEGGDDQIIRRQFTIDGQTP